MINFDEGLSFESYLEKASPEQKKAQEEAIERTLFSKKFTEAIKNIDKPRKIVVFSGTYCPDCIVTLPFIKKIQEINNKCEVYIFSSKGNEHILEEYTGTSRIPTVMAFDENLQPKGVYIEMPQKLSEKMMGFNDEERKNLVQDYRQGKYNNLIEEELIKIID